MCHSCMCSHPKSLTRNRVRLFYGLDLTFGVERICINENQGMEVRNGYLADVLYLCPPSEGGELKSANLGAKE